MKQKHRFLPKRIILVRHGETEVNEKEEILKYVPNHKIKLSEKGIDHAEKIGFEIKNIVSENEDLENWKVLFCVSPLNRTKETLERIVNGGETFGNQKVVDVREECRLRDQHFGNFQDVETRKKIKRKRCMYGKFFFRVPNGESSADVHDRVSSFIEELWRDMETATNFNNTSSDEMNLVVISHGITILLFLMKWFNWTVDQFEELTNPTNCEVRVLQLGASGEYSLAIHHNVNELKEWGLSDQMIQDQKIRACMQSEILN